MWQLVRSALRLVRGLVRPRAHLVAENEFLRQQLAVLRRQVGRARPTDGERGILAFLARLFPWRDREALHLVTPETLIRWHRKGWRLYWTWVSRRRRRSPGPRKLPEEIRELIRDMARRNSQGRPWGVKRILGELEKLGISVSRRTVQKILREVRPRQPRGQRWSTFLHNHMSCVWACDFFTVPTLTFRQLHVFVLMKLDTREVIGWNVTEHPTDEWTAQQLRNALLDRDPPRFLLRDRDGKYGAKLDTLVRGCGARTLLTPYRCPLANSFVERLVGTIRQELLDHVIVTGEDHLRRHLSNFLAYYHTQRPHQGLDQAIPAEIEHPVARPATGPIRTREVLGGLYCLYFRDLQRAAA
jgi:putative transposase